MFRASGKAFLFGAAVLVLSGPALAQKSKDTMRIAINDPFPVLDSYTVPHEEAGYFTRSVYNTLIGFDEHNGKFVPILAKAWRKIDDRTHEFDLRDDVILHSGNKFTADDIKYTIEYLIDPKVKIRFKDNYTFVERVEALGPYKLRIVSKEPTLTDLATISYRFRTYDSAVHKSLANPADYGRVSASSTGPFRMVSLDNTAITFERFDKAFKSDYTRSPIKRIVGIFLPDRQTQNAHLMTGGLDVLRDITADDEQNFARQPNLSVTPTASKQIMYITMDAAGRSPNKLLTDERIRKAIIMAIDRKELVHTFVAGGKAAELPRGICFKTTVGCKPNSDVIGYDPAGAKKLLAEAGYANGVDLVLQAYAPIKDIAVAITGYLHKVGIRATVETLTLQVYVKKRGDGDFTAFLGKYPTSAQPDIQNLFDFFFGADRDYYRDQMLHDAQAAGPKQADEDKRAAVYAPAIDRVNEKAYVFPISEVPIVYAHTKEIVIKPNLLSAGEIRPDDFFWN
jgi:peptide/nickel transport system substrate-binding protein